MSHFVPRRAPAKTAKAPYCRTSQEVKAKHTGTFLPALERLINDNEARFKAVLRSLVGQLKPAITAGKKVHTVAAICEHGKHRSVAVATLLDMMLRALGGRAKVEHLSKANWDRTRCGWIDCDFCDCSQHREEREAVANRALPWLVQLLQ